MKVHILIAGFCCLSLSGLAGSPRTFCRFVPERADDFAWENDKIAFRAYGPALHEKGENSGFDAWLKRVEYPIIDKWYAGNLKGISYHKDHGEGYDPYKVGGSRGCGGLALWIDGKMVPSNVFKEWKILRCEPQESVFMLSYEWKHGDDIYTEEKQISLRLGSRLFKSSSIFRKNGEVAKGLPVAIGLVRHHKTDLVSKNLSKGWMSIWEPMDDSELGTGVVIDPKRIEGFELLETGKKLEDHALIITKTDADGRVEYYAGYGWAKAGGIQTATEWNAYLEAFMPQLENPVTTSYIRKTLNPVQPRLGFTPKLVEEIKGKLETDPVLRNMYAAIRANAEQIYTKDLPDGKIRGRRLLGTSRETLYRINMLGFVYLMEKDPRALERINEEVLNVCSFSSWNPSHFLDVAEMSLAVSLALDWTAGDLPESTVEKAKTALIEKGIKPSWPENGKRFGRAYGDNNWNQVCNGGLIAASITVFEAEPELAAKTIHRALEGLPHCLIAYMPDGIYPEGASYWGYGTSYSIVTISMLESCFGTDFGISAFPGFMASAMFRAMCNAPSGWYFNFADCGDRRQKNGDELLAWFAMRTGNKTFFEKERFLRPIAEMDKLSNISGMAMAWLSQYEDKAGSGLPTAWAGKGHNPIAVFTGGENDPYGYYVGCKGGQAGISHGNMDAGSFIFELNGVRWSIDPGNQSYSVLEKAGFRQWGRGQTADRWKLLIKNNFGHSTLTVNDQLFQAQGYAPLIDFKEGERPEAAFDLSALYAGNLKKASRRFIKDSPTSLLIQDRIETSGATEKMVWQMVTLADVELSKGGAVLMQDGKQLELRVESSVPAKLRVGSLNPPPMTLDKQIEGFKRIEVELDVNGNSARQIELDVRLSDKN